MHIKKLFTPITLMLLLAFSACDNKKQQQKAEEIKYPEEIAKEVSYVTNGDIHFDEVVQIIFQNNIVEESEVETSPANVFSFDPSIEGKAVWVSKSVLEFRPENNWPMRSTYTGTLNLKKLSSYFADKEINELKLSIHIVGRNLETVQNELALEKADDPNNFVYKGSVQFNEKTTLEAISTAAEIDGPTSVKLNWSQLDEKSFQFISAPIKRTSKEQVYEFIIDKDPLSLENTYSEQFTVTPIKEMKPVSFKVQEEGRNPRVSIKFSDDLNQSQDLKGFIEVSPNTKFEVKKLGNSVILDGDFKFGSTYTIKVQKGVKSKWGTQTAEIIKNEISFSNISPQIEFVSDGIILPSDNNKTIQFYSTNIKRVHLEVKKIFRKEIGEFVDAEQLTSKKNRNNSFRASYSSNVGVIVKNQTLELADKKNEWLLNEIDLSTLFQKYDNGIFLIRLNFNPEDMSINENANVLTYVQEKGQIYKPLFLSDLGVTLKSDDENHYVFVTDLITAKAVSGARVSLIRYDGREAATKTTDNSGSVRFPDNTYFDHVKVENGEDITVLKKQEMQWSTSGFDISGARDQRNNTKGFIYFERGVYRPGDSVHVSFIVRNRNNTFPTDHKVTIRVRDPEYNTVFEQTSVKGTDGYYVFGFATDENAPTGNYNVQINAGGSTFYKPLKIETVVAEKLKVLVNPEKSSLSWTDKSLDFDVVANYLFGAPAKGLKMEVNLEVIPVDKQFPKYSEYFFSREDKDFNSFTKSIQKGSLNDEGKMKINWALPPMEAIPSMLKAKIIAKVFEKGGLPNEGWNVVNINPYPFYVGLKDPSGYGYYKTGQEVKFPVVVLDPEGNKQTNKVLNYKIYRNDKNWWYEYDSRRKYKLKYKEDSQTYLEKTGSLTVTDKESYLSFTPQENGEYLVEVTEGTTGHTTTLFFSAYKYGNIPGGDLNEGNLALRSDNSSYEPGETARIQLPNPRKGRVLVTIERGRELLDWNWVSPVNEEDDQLTIEIPIRKDMTPNVYVSVSVIQPHDQTTNDRPIRMFGILPIKVLNPQSKLAFDIKTAKNLVPNKEFTVEVSTVNQQQAQFTIAVVDEGLLSLTQYRTPQPWNEFYQKIGLFVNSYDVFAHVISANKGQVFQTFSIGGDEALDYRASQVDPVNGEKRFKPVCLFKGPIMTNSQGKAKVTFNMPNYNGAVRVMVIGTQNDSYGSNDKTIPVKSDIIMQPTIPRILKPGDEFTLPVSLFRINPAISTADFSIETDGPISVIGNNKIKVDFSQKEEADIQFKIKVKEAIGQAKIIIKGEAGALKINSETAIQVVPTATRDYKSTTVKILKGETVTLDVPKIGLEGTNNARISLDLFPNMDFNHRLKWLINYPYGCIEQTTSAVFPQLMLKEMGYFDTAEKDEIDTNIKNGIARLQTFTLNDGSFSYWPGDNRTSEWGTNYASHFIIEAKIAGYAVPDYMVDNAVKYLANRARNHQDRLTTRVNRAFILALAEKAPIGELNLLLENELKNMSNAEKWMLAAAYHLAGVTESKAQILNSAETTAQEYEPFSYNFGSAYRDQSIMLYCATILDELETAELLAKSLAKELSSTEYLSTQTTGYALLALAKYFKKAGISASGNQIISGSILNEKGIETKFNERNTFKMNLESSLGGKVKVTLNEDATVEQLFATVSYNGVPLKDKAVTESKNLSLNVQWYDEKGNNINPQSLKQGDTFYGRFTVSNTSALSKVSEIALVQMIPSGWQIENVRLNNELLPDWTNGFNLNKEDYLDLRDDRAMWFFDLEKSKPLDFILKLNCISIGEFWLPATLAEAMYNNDFKATHEGKKVIVNAYK